MDIFGDWSHHGELIHCRAYQASNFGLLFELATVRAGWWEAGVGGAGTGRGQQGLGAHQLQAKAPMQHWPPANVLAPSSLCSKCRGAGGAHCLDRHV